MNLPLYIASKISPSGTPDKGAPAVKVAIISVALSITVMIAAIAIVAGFKREISAKITGFNAHISLYQIPLSDDDSNVISLSPSLEKFLNDIPFIEDYSLQLSIPAIFKTPDNFQGIYLKSLEGEGIRNFINQNLIAGKIPDFANDSSKYALIVSQITADQLGLKVGDRLDTYFINNDVRVRPLKVVAIFNSHFDSYDKVYAYGSLDMIQNIAGLRPSQGTSIAIHTNDIDNIEDLTLELRYALDKAFADGAIFNPMRIDNAKNQGAGFFQWLQLLDTNVLVILSLMTFVSIVTLISGLLIIILDNKRLIGLLRALGAPVSQVRKIFIFLALKITCIGMIIGNCLGLLLISCQYYRHFIPLDSDSYYIDFVPIQFSWPSFALLNLGVFIIVWVALIIPSWLTAKISPSESLRYE